MASIRKKNSRQKIVKKRKRKKRYLKVMDISRYLKVMEISDSREAKNIFKTANQSSIWGQSGFCSLNSFGNGRRECRLVFKTISFWKFSDKWKNWITRSMKKISTKFWWYSGYPINNLEGTGEFWSLNPSFVKSNL